MTPTEAAIYAEKVCDTWPDPAQPTADIIAEAIIDLDAGTLGTAIVRLRNTAKNRPTVAELLSAYHQLHTATTDPIRRSSDCPVGKCPGDGWVSSERVTENRTYTVVRPCTCPAGRRNEPSYSRSSRP